MKKHPENPEAPKKNDGIALETGLGRE